MLLYVHSENTMCQRIQNHYILQLLNFRRAQLHPVMVYYSIGGNPIFSKNRGLPAVRRMHGDARCTPSILQQGGQPGRLPLPARVPVSPRIWSLRSALGS